MKEKLTIEQLRLITLTQQGLMPDAAFGLGKEGVLTAIQNLGYLQIDTISVIERAHHHTLWTRVPDYKSAYLDELVQEKKVFEYWFHAASYLPIDDFRFALPQMAKIKKDKKHYYSVDSKVIKYVLDTIKEEGPKRARDFENKKAVNGTWWEWKPAKIALERLFSQGDLMIAKRDGMQKTFDLTERVLPATINTQMPTALEMAEYLTKTYLNAYGFTTLGQITHLKTGSEIKKNVLQVLDSLCKQGTVQQITVEGMPPVYIQTRLLQNTPLYTKNSMVLFSPFDNAIIHRDRLQQLFDYNFRLECYLPKEKRQYGYFCLPILYRHHFVGRVDCKVHRKEKRLELINLHIENQELPIEEWVDTFCRLINDFSRFNSCDTITLTEVTPNKLAHWFKDINNY
ncbi:MAG: winged helix DNA-binding domain-containing protein [Flavobacteriaceae bacterium]|jgi:uncharacterized protein YcaQ|nr:winged helix DNA-binding domain-containing protein [Flavobacteriaceae bacterium]